MHLAWLYLLASAAYWPIAWFLDGHKDPFFMLLDSGCVVFSVALIVVIIPALRRSFPQTTRTATHAQLLSIGILFLAITSISRMGWLWWVRLHHGQPPAFDEAIFGFGLWTYSIGVVTLMFAYRSDDDDAPIHITPFYFRMAFLSAAAAALFLLVLGLAHLPHPL